MATVPDVLKVDDVAEILGVSKWTVFRLIRDGALPYTRVRSSLRFLAEDVSEYLRRNRTAVWMDGETSTRSAADIEKMKVRGTWADE